MSRKGKRSGFGQIKRTKTKHGEIKYQAQYPTPVDAFNKFQGLKPYQYRTFGDETVAQGWLAEQKRKIDANVWVPPQILKAQKDAKAIRFSEYAEEWIKKRRKPNGDPLSPSTVIKYVELLKNHLLKKFGKKLLSSITIEDVQEWWDSYNKPSVIRERAYTLLKSIMYTAATEPINSQGDTRIDRSPCHIRGIHTPKTHKTVNAELEELALVYEAMPPRLALSIYLGGVMGLRIGEVLALRRCDVDMKNATLHVSGSIKPAMKDGKQVIVRGKPKSINSDRILNIPEALLPFFRKHLREFTDSGKSALLFAAPRSGGVMRENVFSYYWRQARAVVPRLNTMRFHDLRHTALQRLVENGASLNMVMQAAGHSGLDVASKYQDGTSRSYRDEITDRVSHQFEQTMDKSAKSEAGGVVSDTIKSGIPLIDNAEGVEEEKELLRLSKSLEEMNLEVRVSVLQRLKAKQQSKILSFFQPAIQIETMTKLLDGIA